MNLAELRMRLEIAAKNKPALAKLLRGEIETREDLDEVATAASELGLFELSFLVRSIASGGERFEAGIAKLALLASSMSDEDLMNQAAAKVAGANPDLAALLRTVGKIVR